MRSAVAWVGVAFFGVVAVLASVNLGRDAFEVATHLTSFTALRTLSLAGVVIALGAAWLVVWAVAAADPRFGSHMAIAAGLATLVIVRVIIALLNDGAMSGEPGAYHTLARIVFEGRCCEGRSVDRPIGYPILLAGAYRLTGQQDVSQSAFRQTAIAGEALDIVLSVLTGLVVLALARGLYGPVVGAVALMLYALWPAGALMVSVRLPQTAYDLAIAAAAWATVATPSGWRGSTLTGLVLGLAQYVRPTTPVLLPIFVLARLWPGGPWATRTAGAVLPMVTAFLLVLLPVVEWNLSTRGALDISTSAHGGKALFHGVSQETGGTWSRQADEMLDELGGDDPWVRSRIASQMALEQMRRDPLGTAILGVRKQVTLWGSESFGVRYGLGRDLVRRPQRAVLATLATGIFYASVTAAAAVGLFLRRRQTDQLSGLLIGTALAVSAVHALLEVRDRYHSYVIPLLMPIAAFAIVWVIDRVRSHRDAPDPEGE